MPFRYITAIKNKTGMAKRDSAIKVVLTNYKVYTNTNYHIWRYFLSILFLWFIYIIFSLLLLFIFHCSCCLYFNISHYFVQFYISFVRRDERYEQLQQMWRACSGEANLISFEAAISQMYVLPVPLPLPLSLSLLCHHITSHQFQILTFSFCLVLWVNFLK